MPRTRWSRGTRPSGRPRRPATGATGRCPAGSASSTAGSSRPASSGSPLAGGGTAPPGRTAGSCRSPSWPCPGAHNVSNALAAVAVGLLFGVAPDAIRGPPPAFTGVEHRLEPVAVIDGVRFVNDSQGTQPDAVIAALRAFDAPLVLIAGGRDKGVDLTGWPPVVAERAAAAVLIGESGPDLERLFRAAGLERIERAELTGRRRGPRRRPGPRGARRRSRRATGPATVLLSPAAASFDMFVDYAARGRAFKARRRGAWRGDRDHGRDR